MSGNDGIVHIGTKTHADGHGSAGLARAAVFLKLAAKQALVLGTVGRVMERPLDHLFPGNNKDIKNFCLLRANTGSVHKHQTARCCAGT